MSAPRTLLIVGGYGVFGSRLVQLLEDEPALTLIVAGRSAEAAARFCRSRATARARLEPSTFDRNGDVAGALARLRPDIVVDASGPFQAYGERRYDLVRACIAAGASYLDLADGAEFVAGIAALDAAATAAGVFVLSGVSSFPVLTAAAVRRLSAGLSRIDSIRGGIAPSPFAVVGRNVVRAIAGYAGQTIPLRRDAATVAGRPLTEHMRFTIAPPGQTPLRSTLFSLVDVPDHRALAELWPQARTIWMGAGPSPEILHRALIALAWLVRLRLLPTLAPLAPVMHAAISRLRWGERRGGMFVAIDGLDVDGRPVRRTWHMLAEGDDGPLVPSMAAAAIVRRSLGGRPPSPGARACIREIELDAYEALFRPRRISCGVVSEPPSEAPLFARVLREAWSQTPAEIRAMHGGGASTIGEGRASVERGAGWAAAAVAWVMRFPPAAKDVAVSVRFDTDGKGETWTRTFGAVRFSSRLFEGAGRSARLLCERFGPLTFSMALVLDGDQLWLVLRRWSVFGIPLPLWLCPASRACESVEDGRFTFDVEIGHRLTGRIVRYRGWLALP